MLKIRIDKKVGRVIREANRRLTYSKEVDKYVEYYVLDAKNLLEFLKNMPNYMLNLSKNGNLIYIE